MTDEDPDPLAGIGVPSRPACLVLMVDEGDADDGADTRWRCPTCGLVS